MNTCTCGGTYFCVGTFSGRGTSGMMFRCNGCHTGYRSGYDANGRFPLPATVVLAPKPKP